ncbi:hypothetical protein Ddye_030956 [Dipteronia dyeriana]|uniref:Arabinanase/levansucrase/invertase n=1 Tax=Dipteronia dyeriana TaxID=168575 RepID=A0AAD9WLY3_9ROSI|nr:hypothetical protein Ddye_030956 [Dipteronia dyeriana]
MEVAAASGIMAAVNFLHTSPTTKVTVPTTLSTPCSWPSQKPNTLALCVPSSVPRTNFLSVLTRCSTKPDTDTNNETDQNPTLQHNSNSKTSSNHPSQPNSNAAISSSLSESPPPSISRGLVFDLGLTNSWDSAEIGSPVVKRFLSDDEERWYMWYCGSSTENPCSDLVGLAISSNGIHWERGNGPVRSSADVGLVMNCSQDWWAFDTSSISPGEVVIMSSAQVRASNAVYWLYYTGYSSEKVNFSDDDSSEFDLKNPEKFHIYNLDGENGSMGKILKSLPGLAISQDGRYWARIEGEHHSGALFDVGSDKDWDSLFISSPQVVFHGNGDLRMFYHSFDVENGEFGIGIARSRDGIKWVKLGKIMGGGGIRGSFDEFGVKNPCVVRNRKDGKYVMVYEGVGVDGKTSIGLAMSADGLEDWRRFQDKAVLETESKDGSWDNMGIGSPCLVQMDGDGGDEWRLYYRGIGSGGRTGIGLAVSEGNDITSLRRWTGFHL